MADEDKDRPRDWGHHKSPIFKLPPEIRNKIYHETFAGSKRDLVLDPPIGIDIVPVTGRRTVFTTAKSTHHFLLTCFQVYSEALAVYWSMTVIDNLRVPRIWSKNRHFTRGYFLNRIPAIARQHVQHLRGVGVSDRPMNRWLQSDTIPRHLSLAESLDFFPNLKSYSFLRGVSFISHVCDEVAARHSHIHTLVKSYTAPPNDAPLPDLGGDGFWVRVTFEDCTAGKILSWFQPVPAGQWMSDEAAFQMVLNAPNVEIDATERRLVFEALKYRDPLEPLKSLGCTIL